MMRDDKHRDKEHSGDAPTMAGYRAWRRELKAEPIRVQEETTDAWRQSWFKPKPAVVHYKDMLGLEHELVKDNLGHERGSGDFHYFYTAQCRSPQIKPASAEQAEKAVRPEYEAWDAKRQELQQEQRKHFFAAINIGAERRLARPDNKLTPDAATFFARAEVLSRYAIQHEDNNERLDHRTRQVMEKALHPEDAPYILDREREQY